MSKENLQKVVDKIGGQVALADAIREQFGPECKVRQGHVWAWLNVSKEEVPPAEYVIAISNAVGFQVTPHELRPDLYPYPEDGMPRSLCACKEQQGVV